MIVITPGGNICDNFPIVIVAKLLYERHCRVSLQTHLSRQVWRLRLGLRSLCGDYPVIASFLVIHL